MKKYIAYYRVSTKKQGASGLGLEAQRNLVFQHIGSDYLVNEYQEVETGKNNSRPELLKAIAECKNTGSTLIIAKLDRLSRNAAFTLTLQDSGVDFVCADFPQANSLTIGLLAVLAQDEAKRISERTTSSLGVIKNKLDKGIRHISKSGNVVTKLGTPANLTSAAIQKGCEVRKEKALNNPESRKSGAFIIALRDQGVGFKEITNSLNEAGFRAPKGGLFSETQVKRMYKRYDNKAKGRSNPSEV